MSPRPLLLGIDEGTSAVKAVLYDTALRPVDEEARRKTTTHPQPGWVEQDAEACLEAVVDAVAALLDRADGEVVACGLDHQGESVLAWDAATGRALSPIVVWQDKRSEAVLGALSDAEAAEVTARSGLPLDPYFSAGKLAWLLRHGDLPDGARLGTVDAFLTDRLGGLFATDASTASRTQLAALGTRPEADTTRGARSARSPATAFDARLCELFGVPRDLLPALAPSVGELGVLRHERWRQDLPLTARVVDQQAALAGAGCVVPGRVKATYGTGVFVLAHVGERAPAGHAGLLPTVAWEVAGRTEFALDGGVFTAGALLEWLSGTLGLAADPPALAALAAQVDDAGGVQVLPALAGLGAPWWRPGARGVIAGLAGGSTPAHVARAALDAIAWRVADIVAVVAQQGVSIDVLKVDGGLTRDPLLLQLQADAAGIPVERGLVDATAAGAAALAAVGAGLWGSTAAIADHIPPGERVEPRRDDVWRRDAHARWQRFADRAGAL